MHQPLKKGKTCNAGESSFLWREQPIKLGESSDGLFHSFSLLVLLITTSQPHLLASLHLYILPLSYCIPYTRMGATYYKCMMLYIFYGVMSLLIEAKYKKLLSRGPHINSHYLSATGYVVFSLVKPILYQLLP